MNSDNTQLIRSARAAALVTAALLVGLWWAALGSAQAQQAPPDATAQPAELTLTPAGAAALALQNSLQLQRDAQSVEQAQARLKQARTLGEVTSQVSASVVYRDPLRGMARPFNELITLSLNKPLYTGHRLETQTALAQRGLEAAGALAAVTASETALAARVLTYNILRLELLAGVTSQRATAVAEHLRITRAMEVAGTVPAFEVVQAETELAKARGEIIAAQTATQQARATLANLLVLPQTVVLTLHEGVPLPQPQGSLTELFNLGWSNRPELALAQRQLRVAEAALQVVRQSTNPRVDLIAQFNQQTATAASEPLNWALGLAVTKPLSDGGLQRAQEQEQAARIADTKIAIEALRHDISLQITQASLALTEAAEQLKVAQAGEVNARERLRMAELRFTAGLSIGIEVLDAQTALAAAQAATVNARYDVQTSVVRLRRAMGVLDEAASAAPVAAG